MDEEADKEDLLREIVALRKKLAGTQQEVAELNDALLTLTDRVLEKPAHDQAAPVSVEAPPPTITPDEVKTTPAEEPAPPPLPAPTPKLKLNAEPKSEPIALPRPPTLSGDLEARIGMYWLNRIGLVSLIVGFALLARLVHRHLEAWHKVGASYLAAAALFFIGHHLRDRLGTFAKPVMAGGIALAFFTSFAAHFVPQMHCMNLGLSLVLMSASAIWLLICADRWGSEPTAGLSIFLGHVAVFVAGGEANGFALCALLILGGTAIALFLRRDWLPLNLFAVVASFASHAFWYLRDPTALSEQRIFWLNLAFLSAYYTLFTVADLIYQKRLRDKGTARYSTAQRNAGRALGLITAALYIAGVAALFAHTEIYWHHIHRFLFPAAALQLLLTFIHRDLRNPNYTLYAAIGSLLFTLGLFSLYEGLTLNLALAFEALLLLILSRRADFWFLSPLAQAVLLVNFFHYWSSDASTPSRLAEWFGGIATAVVYCVKARIEETWTGFRGDHAAPKPKWLTRFRAAYEAQLYPIGLLHTGGAVIIAAHQTQAYFSPADTPLILALIAGFTGAVAIFLRSRLFPFITWGLQFSALIFIIDLLTNHQIAPALRNASWHQQQLTALALVIGATAFAIITRQTPVAMSRLLALVSFVPATLAAGIAPFVGQCPNGWQWLPLLAPLIIWGKAEIHAAPHVPNTGPGPWGNLDTYARRLLWKPDPWQFGFAIGAAAATWSACIAVWQTSTTGLQLVLVAMLALLFVSVKRKSTPLAVGLLALQVFVLFDLDGLAQRISPEAPAGLAWCMGMIYALAAARAGGQGDRSGQRPLRAVGYGHVFLLAILISCLLVIRVRLFVQFTPWLAVIGLGWYAIERLDRRARLSISIFREPQFIAGVVAAACLAILAFIITYFTFDTEIASARIGLLLAIHLLLIAWLITSMPLAFVGATLLLVTIYWTIFVMDAHRTAHAYPWFSFSLVLVILCAGAGAELLRKNTEKRQNSWRWFSLNAANFIAYTAGLYLLAALGAETVSTRYEFAGITIALIPVYLVATVIPLRRLFIFANLYLAILVAIATPIYALNTLDHAWLSGVLVALAIIPCERFLMGLHDNSDEGPVKTKLFTLHRVLVAAVAAVAIATFYGSAGKTGSWATLGWSTSALVLMGLGFLWNDASYRRTALVVFLISIARIVIVDTAQLELFYRTLAYIALGVCLLFTSYLYTRFKDDVSKWLG